MSIGVRKLNAVAAKDIYSRYWEGRKRGAHRVTQKYLATEYGVSPSTINHIVNLITYKHANEI